MATHDFDDDRVILPTSVHLAALGDWSTLPEFKTSFQLHLEPVSSAWREDLIQQGWDRDVFSKPQLKLLRAQPSVIFAELSFLPHLGTTEGTFPSAQLRWARAAAQLFKHLSSQGAQALYFDGSMKVFTPEIIREVNPKDYATLFHLFVEIWGDRTRVATEGMSIFGLPEIVVTGFEPQSAEAQATAFSAAAQMVCDGLRLPDGKYFRASESFPWCAAQWVSDQTRASELLDALDASDESSDDASDDRDQQYLMPSCGVCHLTPVDHKLDTELSSAWLDALDREES